MNKLFAMGILLATALTGCGGGGGGSDAPAAAVSKIAATAGDYYTYTLDHTGSNTSPWSMSFTRAYSTVNGDGSSVRVDTYSTTLYAAATRNLDASFGTSSFSYSVGGVGTTCTNSPSDVVVPLPASVGSSWNNNFTQTCTGGSPSSSTFNNTGSMTALESVVTPAGTFNAGKFVFTQTEVRSGSYTQVIHYTCWIDVVTGRTVKCDSTYTYTPQVGSVVTGTDSFTLIGYKASGLSSSATVARFAGTWSGSYAGSSSGTCSSLVVASNGDITGSCVDGNVGSFTVTGTVNAAGTVSMTASTGPTFSGTLSTTSTGSGTWIGVPSGGGTWTATHK
jgi:hypothetical protein